MYNAVMGKKIFFIDVDGTILDAVRGANFISAKTRYALNELKKNHLVFLNTGRAKCMLDDKIRELDPDGFVLTNGTYVEYKGEVILDKKLDKSLVRKMLEYEKNRPVISIFERQEALYAEKINDPMCRAFFEGWGVNCPLYPYDDQLDYNMAMAVLSSESDCQSYSAYFSAELDVIRQYGYTSFDVDIKGVGKGYGISAALDYFKLPLKDSYAYGDGLNDIDMLEKVGNGIAMANANPQTKKIAKEVCGDVLDDGLYTSLVEKGFIKAMEEEK